MNRIEPLRDERADFTMAQLCEGGSIEPDIVFAINRHRFTKHEALALHAWLTCALVGEDYKLVPIEPTDEMIDAGRAEYDGDLLNTGAIYCAMLAAAPEPARGTEGETQ